MAAEGSRKDFMFLATPPYRAAGSATEDALPSTLTLGIILPWVLLLVFRKGKHRTFPTVSLMWMSLVVKPVITLNVQQVKHQRWTNALTTLAQT